jgi:transposase InsO family protein
VTEDGTNRQKRGRGYSFDERQEIMARFDVAGIDHWEFAKRENLNPYTFKWWLSVRHKPRPAPKPISERHHGPYLPVERKKSVEAFLKSGMTQSVFAETWGVSEGTLSAWLALYEEGGYPALEGYRAAKDGDKRKGSKIPSVVREEIIGLKRKEPSFGFKKIRDWLRRFRGIKVSAGTVGKTVREEGLPLAIKARRRRRSSDKIRRFERARPMQLWQSDITQFLLGRTSTRVYLTVFMDDHSRFIVGWGLMTRQTSDLVLDTFKDAVSRFGKPEEVLTDQGRQYFAWRGKSDLEKLLERDGIKHVVSRSHHPQTLGKCERFWETVSNELWLRARPQDLDEAKERLRHFINHYNFHRPHQGLDGSCPADRFFSVDDQVRAAIEKTVAANALQLAVGELPKPPAFLIGQIGEQKIAFHGTSGGFVLSHENLQGEQNNGISNVRTSTASTGDVGAIGIGEPRNTDQARPQEGTAKVGDLDRENAPQISGDPGAGLMGTSVGRGSCTSPAIDCDVSGVLAGSQDEVGGGEGIGSQAAKILAAHGPSDCGNVCGPAYPTQKDDQGGHGSDERQRRQETAQEDRGT